MLVEFDLVAPSWRIGCCEHLDPEDIAAGDDDASFAFLGGLPRGS